MTNETEWTHRILNGNDGATRPAPDSPEGELLAAYEDVVSLLAASREAAPPELSERVLEALPEGPDPSWAQRLRLLSPARVRWLAPALAGALAALLLVMGVNRFLATQTPDRVTVTFELHAPGAQRVDLVGSFNDWQPGEIVLQGPDATGHWTASVELPAGRHEYLFLLDGRDWMADPSAAAHRPDGFGRQNSLIEL